MKERRTLRWALGFGIVLFLGIPVYFTKIANIDVWKNLITGRYLYWFQTFPNPSVFASAPVREFASKSISDWLSTVVLYALLHKGGWVFLNAVQLLPVFAVLGVLMNTVEDRFGLVVGLAGTILVYCLSPRLTPRTSIFGLFFFPIILFGWYKFIVTKDSRWLWILPPIFVIWGNSHGSYIVGGWIFTGLILGYFLEFLAFKHVDKRNVLMLLLVALVILMGVTFVKPAPDSRITTQFLEIVSGETLQSSHNGGEVSSTIKNSSYLKGLTHDLFLRNRPYVAPEFTYSLKNIDRSDDFIVFFVVPFFLVAYLIFRAREKSISFLSGVLFSYWLGIAFQRALVYTGLTVFLLLVPDWSRVREKFVTWGRQWKVSLRSLISGIIVFGCVWYVEVTVIRNNFQQSVGTRIKNYWELGWGRHSIFRTKLPFRLLQKFPNRNVYNELAIGGIVLFQWWPHKKVFWWPKTSDLTQEILARRVNKGITKDFMEERDMTLAVISTVAAVRPDNPFKSSSKWRRVGQDQLLTAYCKCGVGE